MPSLEEIVTYCDRRLRIPEIPDFPGAANGLQVENRGSITKVAAAVDAGIRPFEMAIEAGADLLVVHHGLFWDPPAPLTGRNYRKIRIALEGNLAVYSAHLPLDLHPEIGNNAILARQLRLQKTGTFLEHSGTPIGLVTEGGLSRDDLHERLRRLFPNRVYAVNEGPSAPEKIAILTGSGTSALEHLPAIGADTLITGELKQHAFNFAQEHHLNLFLCGHYATETLGVRALAEEIAIRFRIPSLFLDTGCFL